MLIFHTDDFDVAMRDHLKANMISLPDDPIASNAFDLIINKMTEIDPIKYELFTNIKFRFESDKNAYQRTMDCKE